MKKWLLIAVLLVPSTSCGVKAPPLPPLPVTAQQSDQQEPEAETQVTAGKTTPSPSPSASPGRR